MTSDAADNLSRFAPDVSYSPISRTARMVLASRGGGLTGLVARWGMRQKAIEIPREVSIGRGLRIAHGVGFIVIHPDTTIGSGVTLFHGVTVGRYDAGLRATKDSEFRGVVIEDNAVLYPGCKIIGGPGITTVGAGSIIAANAVLLQSTGPGEIWGGVPAKRIGMR